MKICISIGHGKSARGGYDSGAVGSGYHEFKLAREIGRYAAESLKNYGCEVTLINYDADMYLSDRIACVNKGGYNLAAEIHLNAGGGTGPEVYYKHSDDGGKKLAAAISKSISGVFGLRDRGAKIKLNESKDDYFGFIRSINCRSLLIETVFIDTAGDRACVEKQDGQKKCGEAIAGAIAGFYALKEKSAQPEKTDAAIRSGDRVKITGSRYATGQKIPSWVKLKKHTVKSISGSRALLREINSWVFVCDLRLVSRAGIAAGSTVTVKPGAVYGGCTSARGKKVPDSQLAPKTHKVSKVQTNRGTLEALLSDISSWVAVNSLEEV